MRKMPDNQICYKISKENPEPQLDLNYFIIEKNHDIKKYIENIKDIKEILITVKKLKENKEDKNILDKYYKKLFDSFNDFSNCSELGCFVNACDTTRDLIRKDFLSFKQITDFFIQNRIIDNKTPENWVQAIIDSNASRKKGKLGENKLIKLLLKYGYEQVKSWEDFDRSKKCVASFSKDVFSFDESKKRLGIRLKTHNQGKMLDLLIKIEGKLFVLEAKHLNIGGGEQNKEIDELIKILELKEQKEHVFYVSFLDGTYSNKLIVGEISKRAKKLGMQRKQIEDSLEKKDAKNYWVNTAGFIALFK